MGTLLLAAVLSTAPADPYEWKGQGPKVSEITSLRELTLLRNDIYARAHNPFRKRWLDTWFRQFDWYQPHAQLEVSSLSALQIRHAKRIADREASLSRETLQQNADRLVYGPRTPEQEIELRLIAARLGGWPLPLGKPDDLSPLEDPDQLDRLLSLQQLADLSPRDLRLLRETVKARRGFAFDTDPDLEGHFSTVAWYHAKKDPKLTRLDQTNIKLISSVLKTIHQPEPSELLADLPKPRFMGWG
ncbi:MAG: YARHG domain-containing protein [Myxococcaceae bacterium]